ncbi:MAG: hypothetical protein ING02_07670 [Roseomonas sp.]|nr:hypothetical protein [Roseomonas sp.]
MLKRRAALLLGVCLLPARAVAAQNATLVMMDRHDCIWCRRWLAEVGEKAWNQSDLGRRAPLRRVDTTRGLPEDLQHIQNWRVTPTFILIVNQQEIGRFRGYGGELSFWQQAEMLMARLPP